MRQINRNYFLSVSVKMYFWLGSLPLNSWIWFEIDFPYIISVLRQIHWKMLTKPTKKKHDFSHFWINPKKPKQTVQTLILIQTLHAIFYSKSEKRTANKRVQSWNIDIHWKSMFLTSIISIWRDFNITTTNVSLHNSGTSVTKKTTDRHCTTTRYS